MVRVAFSAVSLLDSYHFICLAPSLLMWAKRPLQPLYLSETNL